MTDIRRLEISCFSVWMPQTTKKLNKIWKHLYFVFFSDRIDANRPFVVSNWMIICSCHFELAVMQKLNDIMGALCVSVFNYLDGFYTSNSTIVMFFFCISKSIDVKIHFIWYESNVSNAQFSDPTFRLYFRNELFPFQKYSHVLYQLFWAWMCLLCEKNEW